jgi:hypothetical protein
MASEHQLFHLDHRWAFHTRAITVFRDTLSKGFSHFVSSITAPVASGWSGCRVGFAPTGKRRLLTEHARSDHPPTRFLIGAIATAGSD